MAFVNIIMYHYVRNLELSRYPNIKGLDVKLFRHQLDFIMSHFTVICVEDLMAALNGEDLPKNSALLTFDDGYVEHYTNIFPILVENNIQGVFSMPGKIIAENKLLDVNKIHFILASMPIQKLKDRVFQLLDFYRGKEFDFESNGELYSKLAVANRFDDADTIFIKRLLQTYLDERLRNTLTSELFKENIPLSEEAFCKELYMSMDQVKLMQKFGMCFGSHGYDHYWLGNLPKEQMQKDIDLSLEVFDGIIPKENWLMCYPYGSYNQETLDYISSKKCGLGITTEVRVADLSSDNLLTLPRFDTNDFQPKSNNYKEV